MCIIRRHTYTCVHTYTWVGGLRENKEPRLLLHGLVEQEQEEHYEEVRTPVPEVPVHVRVCVRIRTQRYEYVGMCVRTGTCVHTYTWVGGIRETDTLLLIRLADTRCCCDATKEPRLLLHGLVEQEQEEHYEEVRTPVPEVPVHVRRYHWINRQRYRYFYQRYQR